MNRVITRSIWRGELDKLSYPCLFNEEIPGKEKDQHNNHVKEKSRSTNHDGTGTDKNKQVHFQQAIKRNRDIEWRVTPNHSSEIIALVNKYNQGKWPE